MSDRRTIPPTTASTSTSSEPRPPRSTRPLLTGLHQHVPVGELARSPHSGR